MIHHSELLNYIAKKINAKTYLEIGVFNPDHNFNKIQVETKISVDPDPAAMAMIRMESDSFFALCEDQYFDLIFIDGLHHAPQVKKDIMNALYCLKTRGVIVIHDSNPHSEKITHFPRDSKEWTGDIYKTICQIRSAKFTIDFDYGCCVIRKLHKLDEISFDETLDITWEQFDYHRKHFLNLVSIDDAIKMIDRW